MHPGEQLESQPWCSGELRQPNRAKWSQWGGGEEPVAQNSKSQINRTYHPSPD